MKADIIWPGTRKLGATGQRPESHRSMLGESSHTTSWLGKGAEALMQHYCYAQGGRLPESGSVGAAAVIWSEDTYSIAVCCCVAQWQRVLYIATGV